MICIETLRTQPGILREVRDYMFPFLLWVPTPREPNWTCYLTNCNFLTFALKIFIHLRHVHTWSFHPLFHSSNALSPPTAGAGPRSWLRARSSIQVSHVNSNCLSFHCHFPEHILAGSWNGEWGQDWNPGTPTADTGIQVVMSLKGCKHAGDKATDRANTSHFVPHPLSLLSHLPLLCHVHLTVFPTTISLSLSLHFPISYLSDHISQPNFYFQKSFLCLSLTASECV